jgi:transcriptional regulator with XRE-family HTH domain
MTRKFADLRAKMSPASQARADEKARELMAEMALGELRRARGLSQEELAAALQVKQPSVAKFEQRSDMYLSTLRDHIRALGGELEIIARFPDGAVRLANLGTPAEEAVPHREAPQEEAPQQEDAPKRFASRG